MPCLAQGSLLADSRILYRMMIAWSEKPDPGVEIGLTPMSGGVPRSWAGRAGKEWGALAGLPLPLGDQSKPGLPENGGMGSCAETVGQQHSVGVVTGLNVLA
jgi:hypothetical protein